MYPPKVCAACSTPYWNKPRQMAGAIKRWELKQQQQARQKKRQPATAQE
jgi:hypothetical protein